MTKAVARSTRYRHRTPGICSRVVASPCLRLAGCRQAAPNQHAASRPDGGEVCPRGRSTGEGKGSPAIGEGIVSTAIVVVNGARARPAAPYDHRVSRPYRLML